MATCTIEGARIAGVSATIPENVIEASEAAHLFGEDEVAKISESIGVLKRRVAPPEVCTSDLCGHAAERLLRQLTWEPASIDVLIFISQTPDYPLPATACVLQEKLGFPESCAAFDVNLGCSGYVYGLWLASSLVAAGSTRRALLLVGDTASRGLSPFDRSVAMLFGDAGTATAIERDASAEPMYFELGTDGSGFEHLIVRTGGSRIPCTPETAVRHEQEDGTIRSEDDMYMNGAEVFAFTLRVVPRMVRSVLATAGWQKDSVDSFVLHQANRFMLQHLAKKVGVPPAKLPLTLGQYGNTSSASIPLTLCDALSDRLRTERSRLLLAGFGVGLSWGAAAVTCGPACVLPPLTYSAFPERAVAELAV